MKTDDSDHGSSKENCLGRGVMLIAMYVCMYTDYIVLRLRCAGLRCAAPALSLYKRRPVLYCAACAYRTALYCNALRELALCSDVMQCIALRCTVLSCVVLHCTALQCNAMRFAVLY